MVEKGEDGVQDWLGQHSGNLSYIQDVPTTYSKFELCFFQRAGEIPDRSWPLSSLLFLLRCSQSSYCNKLCAIHKFSKWYSITHDEKKKTMIIAR
jgi:hypothetical protein